MISKRRKMLLRKKPLYQMSWLAQPNRPATFSFIPRSSGISMWNPIPSRPVAVFWGDSDRDGIYNGLDCAPHNKFKQGPEHEKPKIYRGTTLLSRKAENFEKMYNKARVYEKLSKKHHLEHLENKEDFEKSEYLLKHKRKIANDIIKINKEILKEDSDYADGINELKNRAKDRELEFDRKQNQSLKEWHKNIINKHEGFKSNSFMIPNLKEKPNLYIREIPPGENTRLKSLTRKEIINIGKRNKIKPIKEENDEEIMNPFTKKESEEIESSDIGIDEQGEYEIDDD
jgi:hypothetical protein